jgi:DNA helicase-2/ATP-dependent DNA helicase PcrA
MFTQEAVVQRFLACRVAEVERYQQYVEDQSPYATHQGVKGAEFDCVVVVLDDEGSRHNQFSYGKLFGFKELSAADKRNQQEGKDSIVERTRRLLYVCCSRATERLAVVLYSQDVQPTVEAVRKSNVFDPDALRALNADGAITSI